MHNAVCYSMHYAAQKKTILLTLIFVIVRIVECGILLPKVSPRTLVFVHSGNRTEKVKRNVIFQANR